MERPRRGQRSEEKISKNVDFSLSKNVDFSFWGNRATTWIHIMEKQVRPKSRKSHIVHWSHWTEHHLWCCDYILGIKHFYLAQSNFSPSKNSTPYSIYMHHNNIEGAKSKGAEKASKYLWETTNVVAKNIEKNYGKNTQQWNVAEN